MVLNSKKTTLAYRCPACGKNIMGMVGMFTLSGDMIRLKCDCGGSSLQIRRSSDGKIHLTVPCMVCPNPHNYTIGEGAFFDKEIAVLTCAYTDVDTCFIGEQSKVEECLKESDEYLQTILDDAGFDSFKAFREGKDCLDYGSTPDDLGMFAYQVDEIVRFVISELKEDGAIKCGCEDPAEADYDFSMDGDKLRVFCKKCGYEKQFLMSGTDHANRFLNCDKIELEPKKPEQAESAKEEK